MSLAETHDSLPQDSSLFKSARLYQKALLEIFPLRKDALLQLIESLAATEKPTSVVELSLEATFQRTFSNINQAITALSEPASVVCCPLSHRPEANSDLNVVVNSDGKKKYVDSAMFQKLSYKWTKLFIKNLPREVDRPFKLFALDATSTPKPHAHTLEDRTYVHASRKVGIPVDVGLQASLLIGIPERKHDEPKWPLPLSIERICSSETPCQVAENQLKMLSQLDSSQTLHVIAADSGYTSLKPQSPNQVVVARARMDRTGRRPFIDNSEGSKSIRGRPKKYEGDAIRFSTSSSVGEDGGPDQEEVYEDFINGKEVEVLVQRWNNVYVTGQEKLVDVVKAEVFLKEDSSKKVFSNPLLVLVIGERKDELNSRQVYESYRDRFDIEHNFRFLKQKLLFCKYQTAEVQRLVNWWWICLMAYWLLYFVREVPANSDKPWFRKRKQTKISSPGDVKRVFGSKIFPELGSPSKRPISRGKSKGRVEGTILQKRIKQKIIKKGRDSPKTA